MKGTDEDEQIWTYANERDSKGTYAQAFMIYKNKIK